MFYLTTHSIHFILRLYGVEHMVKNHSDSERGNTLPQLYVLIFPIITKSLYIYNKYDLSYTSRGTLAGTKNNSMGPP